MSYTLVKTKKEDPTAVFWAKVERIFGEIPKLLKLLLEFNGFDTHLALKGIRWDDKIYFFAALEESLSSLNDLDDCDPLKKEFAEELAANHQKFERFKLKLGHKNLIINLCHELQKTNLEEFNGKVVKIPDQPRVHTELLVRKSEEHGYSRDNENNLKRKRSSGGTQIIAVQQSLQPQQIQEVPVQEVQEFIYETEEDEEGSQFMEQEFLEELDYEQEEPEIVEYQEIHEEGEVDENGIYTTEQIIKSEADHYEQNNECFEISGYDSSSSLNRTGPPKTKKPKHMYTSEFLQTQMTQGRIGTPGRRRPKIQKHYPDTEEGLMDRWSDLVRQSCEVIVPSNLLMQHDLSIIDLVKIHDNIWEVKCPLCTKKLRLQLTQEGKYTNYKRSNFERHLRIVHYSQIRQFKPETDGEEVEQMFEVSSN